MSRNKLLIKEFSLLCRVTVKTLRHYEKIGLLQPAEVDPDTGYRYYAVTQMQTLENIRRLKALGFSLEEIRDLMDDGNLNPSAQALREKLTTCREELERLQKRYDSLLSVMNSQKTLSNMEKFSIQSHPEAIMASHREVIPDYAALGALCCEKIGPEMARLGCRCPEPGYCFTIEHHEYRPSNIDIEYFEQVEEMGTDSDIIKFKRIPAVPTAVCMKHYGPYERLHESYAELFQHIEQQGYKVADRPRCCYIDGIWNQEDPEKWLTLIQVPIEMEK